MFTFVTDRYGGPSTIRYFITHFTFGPPYTPVSRIASVRGTLEFAHTAADGSATTACESPSIVMSTRIGYVSCPAGNDSKNVWLFSAPMYMSLGWPRSICSSLLTVIVAGSSECRVNRAPLPRVTNDTVACPAVAPVMYSTDVRFCVGHHVRLGGENVSAAVVVSGTTSKLSFGRFCSGAYSAESRTGTTARFAFPT